MNPHSKYEEMLLKLGLSERDLKEIAFARLYTQDFSHGTDGHNRLLIVARLANILEDQFNASIVPSQDYRGEA